MAGGALQPFESERRREREAYTTRLARIPVT